MKTQKQKEKIIDEEEIDTYVLNQIYKKRKSVKIELKKGRFKADDGKYHSCLIAVFDNEFIMEDFATECFEGQFFDKLK